MSLLFSSPSTYSYELMTDDACQTVADMFDNAIRIVDNRFGDGYAKKNPALVSKMLDVQMAEYSATHKFKLDSHLVEEQRVMLTIAVRDLTAALREVRN